jgi:STE24 endopeptidase
MHKEGMRRPGGRQRRVYTPIFVAIALFIANLSAIGTKNCRAFAQVDPPSSGGAAPQQDSSASSEPSPGDRKSSGEFHLSPERYQKAVAYSRAGYAVYFVSVGWEIFILWFLLKTRVVARWRNFAETKSGHWIVQGLIFVPGISLLLGLAELPVSIYWHSLSLKYEQSVERWGPWTWDWTKSELLSFGFTLVGALILFAVIRKAPQRWWLYFWFVSVPLVLFLILMMPWIIDPMFHTFVPLAQKHPQLVASIEELTQRAGTPIPPERMFLMQASEKTNQINAYVTGIGASKRVVIWDNTINKMSPDEVLYIVGHEMGHYVLGHVLKGIAFGILGILVALFVGFHALQWTLKRCGDAWGVRGQTDWAAMPVLLLIVTLLGFLSEPIGNGFSRVIEHNADVYGLEVVHGIVPDVQQTAAHSFQVMGELDLADPNPPALITFWLYSHPPLADRLKFAENYDPWDEGKSPKYVQ